MLKGWSRQDLTRALAQDCGRTSTVGHITKQEHRAARAARERRRAGSFGSGTSSEEEEDDDDDQGDEEMADASAGVAGGGDEAEEGEDAAGEYEPPRDEKEVCMAGQTHRESPCPFCTSECTRYQCSQACKDYAVTRAICKVRLKRATLKRGLLSDSAWYAELRQVLDCGIPDVGGGVAAGVSRHGSRRGTRARFAQEESF